ncbi:MAG: putative chromate transport protein [Chloroflexi bacterium ADurb.Bin325]|nr:MAG: putative chromate transport protein [Chloroflexi bacterium ADurb.Bin325]
MNWPLYFWLFLKGSLFSTGGFGNLPFLHADLPAHGWATEADFVQALAVGNLSPGPNGLWTISLGYLSAGWPGAALALLAITLPPMLILGVVALHRRVEDRPAVRNFTRGLSLGVVGLILGVALTLFSATVEDWRGAAITAAALILALSRRAPVFLILALGALAGWLFYAR